VYFEDPAVDLTITVDGELHHTQASTDIDSDGLDDTAIVETDDGSIAFTDTDADGQADLMTQLDADGVIVGQARFDGSAGEWVHVEPDATAMTGELTGQITREMTADTPGGQVLLGAPTHDTDADGVEDSVVTADSEGDMVIYTDADEDGDADFATEITGDGQITLSEHTGDGDWIVTERGHLDEGGQYHSDTRETEAETEAAEESGWIRSGQPHQADVHVDPRTGDWTRG